MSGTKEYILKRLLRSEGYISGESLSNELGISRSAVNAAVAGIRNDGYEITSSTKKGYLINKDGRRYGKPEISALLPDPRGDSVFFFDSVGSTNNVLKEMAMNGAPSGTVVISDEQTSGKGRLGRSFDSPGKKNIYLSYLIRTRKAPSDCSAITACTAASVCDVIGRVCGICPGIKWVNDLVIGSKKICGILTEMTFQSESLQVDSIVIGIGINANWNKRDIPGPLKEIATSIKAESGREVERAVLVAEIISALDEMAALFEEGKLTERYLPSYRKMCVTTGNKVSIVRVHDSVEEPGHGTALEINDDFSLKVKLDDGSVRDLTSGEVSVRGLYGYI